MGNQALPDHPHGGVSEGRSFFSNLLPFGLGSSPDKGDGALQRTQYFKNEQLKLYEKAVTTKKLKGCNTLIGVC